jgi:hypothetical protein
MLPRFRVRAGSLLTAILACVVPGRVLAQAPPPSFEVLRSIDTGWVVNDGGRARSIASFQVKVPGARWIRLGFESIELPETGAKIRITSVEDGGQQELDARHHAGRRGPRPWRADHARTGEGP